MKEEQRHKLAKQMLDPSVARENKRVHPDLKRFIDEADDMCKNVGSTMISRQALSVLIMIWQGDNPTEKPLLSKLEYLEKDV